MSEKVVSGRATENFNQYLLLQIAIASIMPTILPMLTPKLRSKPNRITLISNRGLKLTDKMFDFPILSMNSKCGIYDNSFPTMPPIMLPMNINAIKTKASLLFLLKCILLPKFK